MLEQLAGEFNTINTNCFLFKSKYPLWSFEINRYTEIHKLKFTGVNFNLELALTAPPSFEQLHRPSVVSRCNGVDILY